MSKTQIEKTAKTSTRNSDRRNGKAAKNCPGQSIVTSTIKDAGTLFGYSQARWAAWTPQQREAKRLHAETRNSRRSAARAARRADVASSLFFKGMATVERVEYPDHLHYRRELAHSHGPNKSRKKR